MGILDLPTKDIFKNISWDDFSIFIKKSQISLVKMNGMFRTFLNCTNQDNPGYLITKNMAPSPSFPNQGYLLKNILKWLKSFPTIYQQYTNHISTKNMAAVIYGLEKPKKTHHPAVVTPKASPTPQVAWASRGSWSSLARPGSPEGQGWGSWWAKASGLFAWRKIRGWYYDTTPASCGDCVFLFKMDFGIDRPWLFSEIPRPIASFGWC